MKADEDGFYESLMLNSPVAIAFLDTTGTVITCNPAFEKLFGYSKEEALGSHIDKLVADEELMVEASNYTRRILEQGETLRVTGRRRTKRGELIEVSMQGVPICDGGKTRGVLVIYNDISDLLKVRRNLEYAYSSLSTILDSLDADVYAADLATYEILFMNRHMCDSFGGDLTGRICYQVFRKEGKPCAHCSNARLVGKDGKPTGTFFWEGQNPVTGRWYRNSDRVIPWEDGRFVRLQIAFDITDLKTAEQRLAHAATHDPLTGLPNRVVFQDRLEHAISVSRRATSCVAVLFIDLDGLKRVNDELGHSCGDQLLVSVAERMKTTLRESDTLSRMSGDEFAVILEDLQDQQTGGYVAWRLLESISEPHRLKNRDVIVTASIGGALYPEHSNSPDELLRLSDEAMYSVKKAGKNGIQFYPSPG